MPEYAKKIIREVTNKYRMIFTKQPGKYNGAFGGVNNSLNFSTPPAPNKKVYVPSYTEEMKKILSDKLDQLVEFGLLSIPEDVGVIPEVVSPTLLVPKAEPGEWRIVMDFSQINKSIKPYPSASPTIQDGRNFLARKK